MYLDRISNPTVSLVGKNLTCAKGHVLGVKIVYEKEKRPAFRIFVNSVAKKIVKSKS